MRFIRFCMRDRENGRRQAIVNETYQTNNNNKKRSRSWLTILSASYSHSVSINSTYILYFYFVFSRFCSREKNNWNEEMWKTHRHSQQNSKVTTGIKHHKTILIYFLEISSSSQNLTSHKIHIRTDATATSRERDEEIEEKKQINSFCCPQSTLSASERLLALTLFYHFMQVFIFAKKVIE